MYGKDIPPEVLNLVAATLVGWRPCTVQDAEGEFLVLAPTDAESYDTIVARVGGVRRMSNSFATYCQAVPDWCRHAEEEEWAELLGYLSAGGTAVRVTEDEGEDMCQIEIVTGTVEKGRSTVSPIGAVKDKNYMILETLVHHFNSDAVAYALTFSGN